MPIPLLAPRPSFANVRPRQLASFKREAARGVHRPPETHEGQHLARQSKETGPKTATSEHPAPAHAPTPTSPETT